MIGIERKIRIVNPKHPHYPETGVWTGKVIIVLGARMGKVNLDFCKHGGDSCFVQAGDIQKAEEGEGCNK